jgi:type IVB pilus formation R64 PilN family outer membrane protein
MGTITVTTTPDIMTTIADYISKENKRLSRQIAISIQIYNVNLEQSEDFNLAFSGFLRHMTGQISGLSFSGVKPLSSSVNTGIPSGLDSPLSSLSVAILNTPSDPRMYTNELFTALSYIGDASQVAQFSMTTLNNRPVSRRVGTDRSYVATLTTETTASTTPTTTTSATIGQIHEGFSLQLTPRLLDDGRILLQYSLSLIDLTDMKSAEVGTTGTVSLPITDNRIFVQQSVLRGGQTLIIAGVDQENTKQHKQGVGSPDNIFLGGGTSSDQTRSMMFMALTPQVMDVSADEEHR